MAARKKKRIAILTGGGDCPGLNAVIRAVVKTARNVHGWEVLGVQNGVEGFLDPNGVRPIDGTDTAGILPRGGTILGASNSCNIFEVPDARGRLHDKSDRVRQVMKRKGLHALITVGGEGTQAMAKRFCDMGIPVIGVPKTIDNDLGGTDYTFGFDTAVGVVSNAIDRLYTTVESHHRVMLVEVMGRHTGWIALHGGLAGGAEVILIPEIPYDPNRIVQTVQQRRERGRPYSIVVVSEGAHRPKGAQIYLDEQDGRSRLGGISFHIAEELRALNEVKVRNVVLGHLQRGGTPTQFDRVLATRLGCHAVELIANKAFGQMVALRGTKIVDVSIESAIRRLKRVPARGRLVQTAREMGISFAAADGSDDPFARRRGRFGAP